jgi:hypothetical protein
MLTNTFEFFLGDHQKKGLLVLHLYTALVPKLTISHFCTGQLWPLSLFCLSFLELFAQV